MKTLTTVQSEMPVHMSENCQNDRKPWKLKKFVKTGQNYQNCQNGQADKCPKLPKHTKIT